MTIQYGYSLIKYAQSCAHGLYLRVVGRPIPKLSDQIATVLNQSLDPTIPLSKKSITVEEVDFSDRKFGLFPTVKRAHIISNPEDIKKGLALPREGAEFQFGGHAAFDDMMGVHNMLLHPDHARLRKPLVQIFSLMLSIRTSRAS